MSRNREVDSRSVIARLRSDGRRSQEVVNRSRRRPFLEMLESRQLLSTYTVVNCNDSGPGSLRQAILNANADVVNGVMSPDNIFFNIPAASDNQPGDLLHTQLPGFDPGTQTWTIALDSPLPPISNTVWIDGYTQAHVGVPFRYPSEISSAVQTVALTGGPIGGTFTLTTAAPLPVGTATLPYNATAATVQAALGAIIGGVSDLTVTGGPAPDNGFTITFQNVYAGESIPNLVADGTGLIGGTSPGVLVQTTTVGGKPTGDPTLITSVPNQVAALDGNNARPRVIIDGQNSGGGTGFVLDGSHSLLRGLIISNFNVGVSVPALDVNNKPVVGNLIQGNFIGDYFTYPVDPTTGQPLTAPNNVIYVRGQGNAQQGVVLSSSNTTVGGSNPQENNVICGNGAEGIWMEPGASGNQVVGNQIGIAGPSDNGLYSADGNGAEGILIESSGTLTDPLDIAYASSNYIGSASGGNLISANKSDGVRITGVGANRNLVQGNYIGIAPGGVYLFGTGDPGNLGDGVRIEDGSQNQVGGAAGAGNTIASNHGAGVYITGVAADPVAGTPATGTGNVVSYNMIGVTADGTQVLGNSSDGVAVYAPSNTIGPGNVISQNLRGIGIYGPGASPPGVATATLVVDNLIGTDAAGTQGFGNAFEGVRIDNSAQNTIQGNAAGSQVISGNNVGVAIIGVDATQNLVQGNLIGSDKTGLNDLGNRNEGVLIEDAVSNTIGGTTPSDLNLISANHWGVRLDGLSAAFNLIAGNLIGTDITGKAPLGNEVNGVVVSDNASLNSIGATVSGAGNTIAFNKDAGVEVDSGTGDSILSNSIFSNARLGIDLVAPGDPPSGVTPNAPGVRSGPNDLQNYPILTGAVGGGPTGSITGSFNSIPSTTFLIQFFTSLVPDPSGYGQGQTPIGAMTVTTDDNGNADILYTPSASLAGNVWVTATATNTATGDTSEFSNAVSAAPVSVQFLTSAVSVDATAGSAVIQVERIGNANAVVSVNFATSDGTAIAGKDYTTASGTLTFQVGEVDKTFSVTILPNPSQTASSVTVNLSLSQPTGGATLGSLSTATLTINNNLPPIVQFVSSTYTAYYTSSSSTVTVTRGGGSRSTTVQVDYATAGGTASPGVDYTPVAGTLTFLPNQTTASFTVPILHAGSTTVSKTVGLELSNPTGGGELGARSTATLTIMPAAQPIGPSGPVGPPPQVTGEQLMLGPTGISAVLFSFSQPLNPTTAVNLANYGYYVVSSGPDGSFGTSDDGYTPLASAQYNPAAKTVTLIPATPLPYNGFERITINALANPLLGNGVTSTTGVLLSGLSNGIPGSPFVTTFGVGPQLTYTDSLGKTVYLSLTGGGMIEMFRTPSGDVQSMILVGAIPRKSILNLHANNAGGKYTYFPPVQGAAGVKFRYRTPPIVFRPTPVAAAKPAPRVKVAVRRR